MIQILDLKCYRCGHNWTYKGTALYATNCPKCKGTYRLSTTERDIDDKPSPNQTEITKRYVLRDKHGNRIYTEEYNYVLSEIKRVYPDGKTDKIYKR